MTIVIGNSVSYDYHVPMMKGNYFQKQSSGVVL